MFFIQFHFRFKWITKNKEINNISYNLSLSQKVHKHFADSLLCLQSWINERRDHSRSLFLLCFICLYFAAETAVNITFLSRQVPIRFFEFYKHILGECNKLLKRASRSEQRFFQMACHSMTPLLILLKLRVNWRFLEMNHRFEFYWSTDSLNKGISHAFNLNSVAYPYQCKIQIKYDEKCVCYHMQQLLYRLFTLQCFEAYPRDLMGSLLIVVDFRMI